MLKLLKVFSVSIILIAYTLQVQARDINYKLDINDQKIRISFITKGNNANNTKFKVPTIFELDKSQFQKIKTYVDDIEQNCIVHNNFIIVNHKPFAKIKISYELSSNTECASNLYFNLSSNYFFLFGKYFLLTPELHFNELNNIKFKIWYNNKKVFSNVNYINGMFYLKAVNIQKLNNVFFIGGNVYKHIFKRSNSEIFFSKDTILEKQKIIDFVTKIQFIHNNFFYKLDENTYYIFMSNEKNNIEGTQLHNVQIISLPVNFNFDTRVKRIISHENIHKWLNSVKFGENIYEQGRNCWFIEGFTEYYTDYLNYKNNIISLQKYVDSYNEAIQQYYTSPLKLITNSDLGNNIYDDYIFKLAYLRGRIIAHELDYLIRNYSNNKINLDDYIKYLVYIISNNEITHFNLDFFNKTLLDFTGHDFSKFVEDVLVENKLKVNANFILANQASLTHKKFQKSVYDFDFLTSQMQWKVSGVSKGSNAFLSGLRNGQKILSIITSTSGISFKVIVNNKEKIIKLPTKYRLISVPQYILNS